MNSGIIYVLTNPSFPDYVKIGYADNLEKRLRQLNKSECLPFAFRAYCIYEVDGRLKDKDVHNLIDKLNPGLRAVETFDGKPRIREFYNISPEDAYEILYNIAAISGTTNKLRKLSPEGHEILDEKIAIENNKNFKKSEYAESEHIKHGSELTVRLYKLLKEEILSLGDIYIDYLKHYIAFKSHTSNKNIFSLEIQKKKLRITINLKKGHLLDTKCLTRDVSQIWHLAPGDYLLEMDNEDMIDYATYLIKQAVEAKK